MMRLLTFPLSIFLAAALLAEDELPKDPGESLDIEPPLLIQEIPSRGSVQSTPGLPTEKELDSEWIQIALEKAKKSAAAGERLYKSGVIAKVEAENRSLKVIQLETELAEIAKTTLVAATNKAQLAAARRDRAELDAALLNLSRQKKLLALASGRKSEDGLTFGITEVTATDSPDADAKKNMKLKIGVNVRPNTVIDYTKVKIQVFLYDTVDNKEVVLTDADVSYEWLTPHHDWKDTNPEVLAVTLRPKKKVTPSATVKNKTTKELSSKDTYRKYQGYIVRIYYNNQLQVVRADPTKLLNLFPPPFTCPSK